MGHQNAPKESRENILAMFINESVYIRNVYIYILKKEQERSVSGMHQPDIESQPIIEIYPSALFSSHPLL